MSSRSNPFAEIERMFERMSRQFEEASRKWGSGEPFAPWMSEFESMAVDVVEHDDEFVVTVDLPGFDGDEVDVRVTDQMLRIDAEREEAVEETDEEYLRRERRHESMRRSVGLPGPVDEENVEAHMRNGVLTVTLPKTEVESGRTIEIE